MTDATDSGFDGRAYARALTAAPGVYRMFDGSGSLLYVGKAKSLKKRVGSYFARPQLEPRIAAMVAQVTAIEVTVVRTESEALILENELIKSLNPRYNVMLKDSKGYPSIFISAQEFPRIAFHRGARKAKGRYFGPYPSTVAVRDSINRLQKLFRLRNCVDSFFQNRSRPCLQYQIKRCTAPCVGLVSAADYARDVRHAVMFLEGRSTDVIDELVKSMEQASADLAFENAAELRDEISRLRQMQAKQFVTGNEQDADVIGCVVRDGQACVQALFLRDYTSFGSHHWLLRATENAGAAEVHFRIASPPTAWPCFYGVDTPERSKLLAATMSEDEMRDWIGVDSLKFVTLDGLYRAAGEAAGRDAKSPRFCDACFSGDYPVAPSDKLEEGFEMKAAE